MPSTSRSLNGSASRRASNYHERDWMTLDLQAAPRMTPALIYFDDHVDQWRRVREAAARGFRYLIFDDSLPSLALHNDGWAAAPTIDMLFEDGLGDGEEIHWRTECGPFSYRHDTQLAAQTRSPDPAPCSPARPALPLRLCAGEPDPDGSPAMTALRPPLAPVPLRNRLILGLLFIFLAMEVFTGPLRFYLAPIGLSPLVYLPKLLIVGVVIATVLRTLYQGRIRPLFSAVFVVFVFFGLAGWMFTGNPLQPAFGIFVLLPLIFAVMAEPIVRQAGHRILPFVALLWFAAALGQTFGF